MSGTPESALNIGVITTSRADYGIYRPLLAALRARGTRLILFAGGTHNAPRYGNTIDGIRSDAFGDVRVVAHLAGGDLPRDAAESCGRAVHEFAAALDDALPDLLFVLGDRYEMLAAGLAAVMLNIPIAHLHGGDLTEGANDNQFRHALTKLAHLHFPALPEHARRIRAMGEEEWRVHAVGALALDAVGAFQPEPCEALAAAAGLDPQHPTLLLACHPETLGALRPRDMLEQIVSGLSGFDGNLLMLGANADAGREALDDALRRLARTRPRTAYAASLSQQRFWSWMSCAAAMVGNSSSALLEAPSFRLPAVNVGDRQAGRARAANVIDVPADAAAIASALRRALSPEFRRGLADCVNPYGDGRAAERILAVLTDLPSREQLLRKRWI